MSLRTLDFSTGGIQGSATLRNALAKHTVNLHLASGYLFDTTPLETTTRSIWNLPAGGHVLFTDSATEAIALLHEKLTGPWNIQSPSYFSLWRLFKDKPYHPFDRIIHTLTNTPTYLCPVNHPAATPDYTFQDLETIKGDPLIVDATYVPLLNSFQYPNRPLVIIGSYSKIIGSGFRCGFIWTNQSELFQSLRSTKISRNLGCASPLWDVIPSLVTPKYLTEFRLELTTIQTAAQSLGIVQGQFLFLPPSVKVDTFVLDSLHYYYPPAYKPSALLRLNLLRQTSEITCTALKILHA